MDYSLKVTDRHDADFLALTQALMGEYVALYGDEALEFCPAEALEEAVCAVIAYHSGEAVASGAIRSLGNAAELMRIYVAPDYRRQGLGAHVVLALESEAANRGFARVVLVTGLDIPAALALYARLGYSRIETFGPMRDDPLCVCMGKTAFERLKHGRTEWNTSGFRTQWSPGSKRARR